MDRGAGLRRLRDDAHAALAAGDAPDAKRRAKAVSALVRAECELAYVSAQLASAEEDEGAVRAEIRSGIARCGRSVWRSSCGIGAARARDIGRMTGDLGAVAISSRRSGRATALRLRRWKTKDVRLWRGWLLRKSGPARCAGVGFDGFTDGRRRAAHADALTERPDARLVEEAALPARRGAKAARVACTRAPGLVAARPGSIRARRVCA